MNQLVLESTKRLNTLEDILLNNNNSNDAIYQQKSLQNFDIIGTNKSVNNSILISTQRDSSFMKQNYTSVQNNKYDFLLNKINKLEKAVFKRGSYLGREEEINMGLTKVDHLEKKFEIFLDNFNKDINIIKNNIKQNMDNIDNINSGNNILNEKFDNLYKNFNDTNININKYNYQTTLALNETQKKLDECTDYFNNAKADIDKKEKDLNEDYIILKQILNDKLNEYEKELFDMKNNIDSENNELKLKLEEKQENYLNLIQKEKDEYLNEAKNENKKINNNINDMKNSFFHNLNEIEQYFNRKYQTVYKAINLQEN